jgi:hypothetical protein
VWTVQADRLSSLLLKCSVCADRTSLPASQGLLRADITVSADYCLDICLQRAKTNQFGDALPRERIAALSAHVPALPGCPAADRVLRGPMGVCRCSHSSGLPRICRLITLEWGGDATTGGHSPSAAAALCLSRAMKHHVGDWTSWYLDYHSSPLGVLSSRYALHCA